MYLFIYLFLPKTFWHTFVQKKPIYAYQQILCILGFTLNNYNNNSGFLYSAFSYMLKALHILLPQQACVILHIYSFSVSTLENTVPIAADYTR